MPWLAVNPNYTEVNAAADRADPDGVFHHHRRLVELRHTEPTVVHGDFTMLLPDDEQVYAFTRQLDGTTLLVLTNISGHTARVPVEDAAAWAEADLVLGNLRGDAPARWAAAGMVELRPWEALVLRRTL